MKQKLLDIKLILRIIISVLIIFSMLKSCAKALSYEEIQDYVNQTADYYTTNSNYQTIKSLVNNNTTIKNFLNNNASNYNTICLGRNVSFNFFYQITLANFNTRSTNGNNWAGTGNSITISYDSRYGDTSLDSNSNFTNSSPSAFGTVRYMTTNANNFNNLTGMCYENFDSYIGEIGATYVGKEHLVPAINIYFGNMFSTTITYNNEEMQANELSYNYRIEYVDNVVTEDNEITSMQATLGTLNLECQDLGSYWTLKCNNSTLLQYNQVYDLIVSAIVNGDEEEIEEKIIFVPPGTTISGGVITNIPSGDYGFSTENATNQIIENQQQQQEENKNFFENLYTNMFTMNSGEVSGEVNRLINSLNLTDSGEREIIGMIYDEFNREPSDFVISWEAKNITIDGKTIPLIPSGEINFSEKCREEPSLARIKGLINVMVSASLLMAFIIGNHDMILRLLGTENTFLDDDRVEYVVTAEQVAQEALPPPNYPTWSGTDPNYWWYRARKR